MTRLRIRTFLRRWSIVLIAALIGVAMTGAIVWLSGQSARADRQGHLVRALATHLSEQNANEWHVIAEGFISADLTTAIHATWGEIESALGALDPAAAEDAASAQALRGLVARYRSALSEEFDLVAGGQVAEAKEIDEAQVDPLFAKIDDMVDSLSVRFDGESDSARTLALVSSILTVLLGVGLITVLSMRAATRRATVESEVRFRVLVQNGSDVTAIVDRTGALRYVTASVERVLGYRPEALLGRPFIELVHPEDREAAGDALACAPGAPPPHMVARLLHRDGSWPSCEILAANLLAEPAVRGIVVTTRDVTERESLRRDLVRRATHDDLTGLPNRALFNDRLQHALARRIVANAPRCAVLFVDLDGFKAVNDGLGHEAGDDALRVVAERLLTCIRPSDTVARMGGDEFAVLVEDLPGLTGVEEIADRIVAAVARPIPRGGATTRLSASLGIALSRPDSSPEDLLREADRSMYSVKRRRVGGETRPG